VVYSFAMNSRKSGGKPYTHFIGVPVGDDLASLTEDCRRWMGERYGCKSGYRTEPHVTLIAPFALGADDAVEYDVEPADAFGRTDSRSPRDNLARILHEAIGALDSFSAHVQGFGTFGDRTIYARVVCDPRWDAWRSAVWKAVQAGFPGMLPPLRGAFVPHLTVANRDVPAGAVAPALEYFASLGLDETFTVGEASLFEFANGRWETVERFCAC